MIEVPLVLKYKIKYLSSYYLTKWNIVDVFKTNPKLKPVCVIPLYSVLIV